MEKIWLTQYDSGVPHEINPDIYCSIAEMFEDSCQKFADRIAFTSLGENLTFDKLYQKARDFAAYLQNVLRHKKGERIALMLPNVFQYPICMFGSLMAGLTVINVNPLYTVPELVKQLSDSRAETIVVLSNFAHVLQHALPETRVKNVIVTELGDACNLFKAITVNFVLKRVKKAIKEWQIPYAETFRRAMNAGRKLILHRPQLKGEDLAFLQYTGGTTGISKGAMLSHRNLLANIEQVVAWIGNGLSANGRQDSSLVTLPLYHVFALTVSCFSFIRLGIQGVLIPNPRDLDSIVHALAKHRTSLFVGVNTLFNALVRNSEFKRLDFSSLKFSVAGGMAVQSSVAEAWVDITGSGILEGYGLTEASPVVSMNPLRRKKFSGSIGLPMSSTEVSIRDDDGNELSLGSEGELCVKGPQVMQGYWGNEEETAKVFWEDGWLKTGDIGLMDENGFLYIVDRKKDMIVTTGYNVFPNEVEDVIASHPLVKEVAVVGIPHKHAGELVKAYIVREDESLTKDKVIAFCKDRLTSYKVPKRVEFREDLPKSQVGKVLRRALK
ncbi:MAG: AMP-binding protein [Gammaproteobacteria bacterium]|nr:AMP-binding protein [Gammaproteobacteria bacterium]